MGSRPTRGWSAILALGAILLSPDPLVSRPGRFHRFERFVPSREGTPVPGISSVLQDREGFLWFGTVAGLARYDGRRFRFFDPSAGPAPEQASTGRPIVYPVLEDSGGAIWFGTNGQGVFRFDKTAESFTQYRNDPADPASLSDDIVLALQEDRAGSLWIGTRLQGLNRFDPKTRSFTRIPLGQDAGAIWDILADRDGVIWVGTENGGLHRLDPQRGVHDNFRFIADDPRTLGSNTVWSIFQDGRGTIWAGTKGGGLNAYDPLRGEFLRFAGDSLHPKDLVSPPITAIAEDGEGRIWIGTAWDGLRIWNRKTGEYVVCRHDPQDPDSLGDDNITSISRDASGIMWIGTTRGGIGKCLAGRAKILHFKHDRFEPSSLARNDVRAIRKSPSGALWIGSDQGFEVLAEETGRTYRLPADPAEGGLAATGSVTAFWEDAAGRIWAGTEGNGIIRIDLKTGRCERFLYAPGRPNTLSDNKVYEIRPDPSDSDILWIGTHRGLNRLDIRTGRFVLFVHDPSDPGSLSGNVVTALLPGRSGAIWVGTRSGLNRLEPSTGRCERFIGDIRAAPASGPNDNLIHCLHEDSDGILWMGTDGGLNRYDPAARTWKSYAGGSGLPGGIVNGILEDDSGRLWLGTDRGLARFDPRTDAFTVFGLQDGIQADHFNARACFKDAGGRMYFGGVNGFNVFRPSEFDGDSVRPPLAWTGFARNGREQRPRSDAARPPILRLISNADAYGLEFAVLDFAAPGRNRLAFRLEPRDRDWIPLGTDGTVTLERLRPDDYRLRVRGAAPDVTWSPMELEMAITAVAPFWRTAWFAGLAILFFAVGAAIVLRMWLKLRSASKFVGRRAEDLIGGHGLTAREQEILRLILRGARNKDIEKELYISASTVRNHIHNIYGKLGVGSRLELINRIGEDARK
jgi:ligand-binding sensor domain-containing protein/DNA-binding CsgD family transcriptional regulator